MSYARKGRNLGASADAEIAELKESNISLGYELAAADSTIEKQEQALLEKNAEIETLSDTVRQWEAYSAGQDAAHAAAIAAKDVEIANLEAALAACEGTTEPPLPGKAYPAALGYCPEPNTPTEVKRLGEWSGGKVRRSYLPPMGSFPANPTFMGDAPAGLRTAHTFKMPGASGMKSRIELMISGRDDEKVINYILKSAKNSIWGFEHEPEDDFAAGGWDKSIYRSGQRKFCSLVDEANKRDGGTRLKSMNLMSVTDQPAEITQWFPGEGYLDVIGFDGYNWPNRTPGSTSVPGWAEFESIFTPDRTNTLALGCDFAIFEYGCRKAHLFNEVNNEDLPTLTMSARQVDWHQKAWAKLQEWQPVCATYFHHDWWLMREEGHRAMGGQ